MPFPSVDENEDGIDPRLLESGPVVPASAPPRAAPPVATPPTAEARAPDRHAYPEPGDVWGDFRLGEMLGQGGMGMVFKAQQLSLNRPVALKVLTPYLGNSESFRARFLREAQSVARIASPHVVQVYSASTDGGRHWFAMEFVDGEDLGSRLDKGWRPSRAEALDIITQATRGLVAAGEHDIVHRDIKPGNMMITRKGVVKLMDFGLVRIASEERMTTTGVVMGTPYYFSPEQARGEDCDQRADIYSLGVVLYELLTGQLPFTGEQQAVVYAHLHRSAKKPRDLDGEIPHDWQDVVLTCMAKRADARYRTASELLRDLERLAAEQAPALVTPPRQPNWLLRAGVAAAVVAAVTAASRFGTPTDRPSLAAGSALPPITEPARQAPPVTAPTSEPATAATVAAVERSSGPAPGPAARPEAPLLPSELPPQSASCGGSVVLRVPARPGAFIGFRWSLEGAPGACGRLEAEATTLPENTWLAPARAAQATAVVVARAADGREQVRRIALGASGSDASRALRPVERWTIAEPASTRLVADGRGCWWASDATAKRLRRIGPGWQAWEDLGAGGEPIAALGAGLALLEPGRATALSVDEAGVIGASVPLPVEPRDVAGDGDALLLVDAAGSVHRVARDGTALAVSAVAGFTRVAVAPDGRAAALAPDLGRVQRLDRGLKSGPAHLVPPVDGAPPADVAFAPSGLLVLRADGSIHAIPDDGEPRSLSRPTGFLPVGPAAALTVGRSGEVIVSWPEDGCLTRVADGGWPAAVRGGAFPRGTAFAADGTGRVWTLSGRTLLGADASGWCVARVPAVDAGGGEPRLLAVSPDGRSAVVAQDGPGVIRVDLVTGARVLLGGAKPARIARPAAAVFLDDGDLFVLDASAGRIAWFDARDVWRGDIDASGDQPARIAAMSGGRVLYLADRSGTAIATYERARGRDAFVRTERLDLRGRGMRADALACDRRGRLYLLDRGRTLRVLHWSEDEPLCTVDLRAHSADDAHAMAVSPDGQVWIASARGLVALRW